MLKFIKHHMESILGIEIFPVVSLLIFFIFFVLVGLYAFRMKKADVQEMAAMPLHDDPELEPER